MFPMPMATSAILCTKMHIFILHNLYPILDKCIGVWSTSFTIPSIEHKNYLYEIQWRLESFNNLQTLTRYTESDYTRDLDSCQSISGHGFLLAGRSKLIYCNPLSFNLGKNDNKDTDIHYIPTKYMWAEFFTRWLVPKVKHYSCNQELVCLMSLPQHHQHFWTHAEGKVSTTVTTSTKQLVWTTITNVCLKEECYHPIISIHQEKIDEWPNLWKIMYQ